MSHALVIEPDAAALGLGNAAAVLLSAREPFRVDALVDDELADAVANAAPVERENDGYGEVLERLGYPGVEPAGRKLVRLAKERGVRSYGLLVDACNVVALRHGAGIGLHDVGSRLDGGDLVVFRAGGSERIVPAFRGSEKAVPRGDLLYGIRTGADFEPLAWLGKRDTDAAAGQIRETTTSALIVVLGHGRLTKENTVTMCTEVTDLVRRHRPDIEVTPLRTVLAGAPSDRGAVV